MTRVQFYLPFWWDSVYPDFNEWEDTWTGGFQHHQYFWELDDETPFDGLLLSRENTKKNKNTQQKIRDAGGVRQFLDLPDDIPLFGDIGAFGYRTEEKPPYDPIESLQFYQNMGYDSACTVDHLITSQNQEDKQYRWNITIQNALAMLDEHQTSGYDYDLYGVVQGWGPESYREGVQRLVDAGFRNLAIGGLVRANSTDILEILQACYPIWRDKDINVHLFGVARWGLMSALDGLEVDSIDNAYHRSAWLSKTSNYEIGVNRQYTAIRIPLSHPHSKERIPAEQDVFNVLRDYQNKDPDTTPEDVVETLTTYENEYAELKDKDPTISEYREEYIRTLRDRPWGDCSCSACREYGLHVAIFRCNERNMRRGYHNLTHFYDSLRAYFRGDLHIPERTTDLGSPQNVDAIQSDELDGDVLVITSCTAKKQASGPGDSYPVREMYTGRLFQRATTLADGHGWDYRVISAKYGWLHPDEEIAGYDERLSTKSGAHALREKVIPELSRELPEYDSVLVLAGRYYREVIRPLMDYRFHILGSDGYGDLCSRIQSAVPGRNAAITDY